MHNIVFCECVCVCARVRWGARGFADPKKQLGAQANRIILKAPNENRASDTACSQRWHFGFFHCVKVGI